MIAVLCLATARAHAQGEVTSNGTGGGPWSSPSSWRGNKVPGPGDDVFIRKFDAISCDQSDGKVSCQKLQIDPKGVLQFKTGAGKVVCTIADGIDNHGVLKIDGTRSAQDLFEIRFTGPTAEQRKIKLHKGAGLLLYGKSGLAEGKKNIALVSAPPADDKKEPLPVLIEAEEQVAVDVQRARLDNVILIVKKVDNTGARPNERIQVMECDFLGQGQVVCQHCDTPVIARNTFDYRGKTFLTDTAINTAYCPLAEIKGNTIRGKFGRGIAINYQSDASVVGNIIEGCEIGIQGGYGIPSTMIKQNSINKCDIGVKLEGASGVVEEVTITGAKTGLVVENANLQLTHVAIKGLDPKGVALLHLGGKVALLNCTLKQQDIKLVLPKVTPKVLPKDNLVECHQVVIVGAPKAPEGAVVEIRTMGLKEDLGDPNVRNSPAALVKGKTSGLRSLVPLMVKTWALDPLGKPVAVPEYQVKLLGVAAKEGEARKMLAQQTFRPTLDAFRDNLEDDSPTLEVMYP